MTGPTEFHRPTLLPILLIGLLTLAVAVAGCAGTKRQHSPLKPAATSRTPAIQPPKTIVTPDVSLLAKVVSVNLEGRFVVLNFPSGEFPQSRQTLFLYRAGLKMAEVRATGRKTEMDYTDNTIVADLISGNAQVGDTVRDE